MKKICTAMVLCWVAVFVGPYSAQAETGPYYISLYGGTGVVSDLDRSVGNGSRTATIEFDAPYGLMAAVGRNINDWFRLEAEVGFIEAKSDEVVGHFGQQTDESGREQFINVMINGVAEYENKTGFTPFLGVGVGAVHANHDICFDPDTSDKIPAVDSHDSEWAFGYQIMAGVGYQVSTDWTLELMYRFFAVDSRSHSQNNVLVSNVEVDSTYIHLAMIGTRYTF